MSSKKTEQVEAPVKDEPTEEELLTDEEINEAVGESAIAVIEDQGLEPIDTLNFGEDDDDFISNIGLTRSQLVEMNAAAETAVRLEEAMKDHHREELQREKAANARKKLADLKNRPDAIARLVKQISAVN